MICRLPRSTPGIVSFRDFRPRTIPPEEKFERSDFKPMPMTKALVLGQARVKQRLEARKK